MACNVELMKKYKRIFGAVFFFFAIVLILSRFVTHKHSSRWTTVAKDHVKRLNAQANLFDQKSHVRTRGGLVPPGSRLTRLASQLRFNYSFCPSDSLVRTNPDFSSPNSHSDCPDLFIIGTRKGGTTSLIQYLSKHPKFKGPRLDAEEQAGEVFYFTIKYETRSWKYYMSLFPHLPGVLTGESSVSYSTGCEVPQRIVRDCGGRSKVVYLLRNPYRRFESNYLMRTRLNVRYTSSNFDHVFDKEWQMFSKRYKYVGDNVGTDVITRMAHDFRCMKGYSGAPNMLYDSLYLVFLSNWLCNYPSKNIMIMNSEEFFKDPRQTLSEVFDFLGISQLNESQLSSITSSVYNKGGTNHSASVVLNDKNKGRIQELFEPFTKALLDLLQWDVDWSY